MRKQGLLLWLLVTAMVALAQPLVAADRYVQGTIGSDASDCSIIGTPCLTISYAVTQSACGDVINVHGDSIYDETVPLPMVCTSGNELTLRGWPGTGTPTISSSTGDGIDLTGAYITIDGIRFESNVGVGIDALGVDNLIVQNSEFIGNAAAGIQSIGGGGND